MPVNRIHREESQEREVIFFGAESLESKPIIVTPPLK
jgi:hypothetical protein